MAGRTVFAPVMAPVPQTTFRRCVARYGGEYKASRFSCWDQYLCMAFAQLTYRESLSDIEACLRAVQKLYHRGIRTRVARSTSADANETRPAGVYHLQHQRWRIYADLARGLIRTAPDLYVNEPRGIDLADTVYALAATIISVCPCVRGVGIKLQSA